MRYFILVLFAFCFSITSFAQEIKSSPDLELKEQQRLKSAVESIQSINLEIKEVQKQLKTVTTEQASADLAAQLNALHKKRKSLENSVIESISGTSVDAFQETEETDFTLTQELQLVLEPVLTELKKLSEEPRKIEKLSNEIRASKQKLATAQQIQQGIQKQLKSVTDPEYKKFLTASLKEWQDVYNQTKTELGISQQKLATIKNNQKSFSSFMGKLFDVFFKTRGKHIGIAVLSCLIFWFILHYLKFFALSIVTKARLENSKATTIVKIAHVVLLIIGIVFVFMLSLFLLKDWLLLVLTGLILLGILWSTKEALPRYWSQIILLTNSGAIRENERVLINGLPYLVNNINLLSKLENPLLDGGKLRLPLDDLQEMRSRPFSKDENWYPTKKKDWIYLQSLDLYGKVIAQTPEVTTICKKGGSYVTIPSDQFFAMNPENLSVGYRLLVTFGLDYNIQKKVVNEVLDVFKDELQKRLKDVIPEDHINSLKVEFNEAGASSLDIAVLADFTGEAGDKFRYNRRMIQTKCVEICNQYGYNIPFTQLTVHMDQPSATTS